MGGDGWAGGLGGGGEEGRCILCDNLRVCMFDCAGGVGGGGGGVMLNVQRPVNRNDGHIRAKPNSSHLKGTLFGCSYHAVVRTLVMVRDRGKHSKLN